MKKIIEDKRGIAYLWPIIIAAVVVVAGVGYYVWNKNKNSGSSSVSITGKPSGKCEYSDKDLCKFITNWKMNKYYTIESTDTSNGATNKSTIQYVSPDRFYMKAGGEAAYEMIMIGNTTYTKAGDTWYKQTAKSTDNSIKDNAKRDFKEPSDDNAAKTEYKKLGTEACGSLTCYKYQVVESSTPDSKTYIWFDTKDYQLRRTRTESANGGVSDQTMSYEKISINAPKSYKELGPNQYIMPGSTEPTSMPSMPTMPTTEQ